MGDTNTKYMIAHATAVVFFDYISALYSILSTSPRFLQCHFCLKYAKYDENLGIFPWPILGQSGS